MAKYHPTIRTARQQALLDGIRSGNFMLCSGTAPTSLTAPGSGSILSEHAIGASAGSCAAGVLSLGVGDLAQDASANNTGVISYAIVVTAGTAQAMWKIPSEMTVSINGGSGNTITSGLPVDINSVKVNEGNPA